MLYKSHSLLTFAGFQELEYIRSYLFGRMAWGEINGLLLVSGGLGMSIKKQSLRRAGTGIGRLVKIWNSLQNEKINASKKRRSS
jgi:hypothetical protein